MLTWTLQLPKPYITKYFDSMTNDTPIIYILKERQMCYIIVVQQELNTTEHKDLDQDSLEDVDWEDDRKL